MSSFCVHGAYTFSYLSLAIALGNPYKYLYVRVKNNDFSNVSSLCVEDYD